MPRKDQGWITFQVPEEERQLLETICRVSQRTKTEVLRELLRSLKSATPAGIEEPTATRNAPPTNAQAQPLGSSLKKPFKVSSRNVFEGKIKHIIKDSVNTEVTLEIVQAVELTSTITTISAETLELAKGKAAYAVIKASDVVIAVI